MNGVSQGLRYYIWFWPKSILNNQKTHKYIPEFFVNIFVVEIYETTIGAAPALPPVQHIN